MRGPKPPTRGHQLLLPPANCCPMFAVWTAQATPPSPTRTPTACRSVTAYSCNNPCGESSRNCKLTWELVRAGVERRLQAGEALPAAAFHCPFFAACRCLSLFRRLSLPFCHRLSLPFTALSSPSVAAFHCPFFTVFRCLSLPFCHRLSLPFTAPSSPSFAAFHRGSSACSTRSRTSYSSPRCGEGETTRRRPSRFRCLAAND